MQIGFTADTHYQEMFVMKGSSRGALSRHWRWGLTLVLAASVSIVAACSRERSVAPTSSADGGATTDSGTPAASGSTARGALRLGYYTGDARSYSSLTSFARYIDAVSADVFGVGSDGSVEGAGDPPANVLQFDKDNSIRTYACVSNYASGGFDRDLGHTALVIRKAALIDNLAGVVQAGGFDGVNIDFENIAPGDRDAYSLFVHDLAVRLHQAKLELVLSVPAKSSDDLSDDWSGAYDYAAIGKEADLLQLMTYDEHGPGWSDPGPVSGYDWVEGCVKFASSVVDPARLLVGLPAYGYDWKQNADGSWSAGNASGGAFPWVDAPDQNVAWDATSRSPHADYTDGSGAKHEAWFENADSIAAKAALVKEYGLAGVSMWSLGQEDAGFWIAAAAGMQ